MIAFADELCPGSRSESDAQRDAARAAMDARGQSGRILFEQGQALAASGAEAEAQRHYDRAIAALEAETRQTLEVDVPFLDSRMGYFDTAPTQGEVAIATDAFVFVVNAATGVERMRLKLADGLSEHDRFDAVAFSHDGERIYALSGRYLQVWERETGTLLRTVRLRGSSGNRMALSKDERTLWISYYPDGICRYDLESGRRLDEIRTRAMVVRASPGGHLLPTPVANPTSPYSGKDEGMSGPAPPLALIDVESARVVAWISAPMGMGSAAISPDGSLIAITSQSEIDYEHGTMFEMRKLPRGSLVWRKVHLGGSAFSKLEFSADGRVLHLASFGLLNVANGDFLHREFALLDTLFDGFLLSDGDDGKAWSWVTRQPAHFNGVRLPDQSGKPGKLIPQFMLDNLYDAEWKRDVMTPSGVKVAVEWLTRGNQDAELWGVTSTDGLIELNGTPQKNPICRVGHWTFPYALCRERVQAPNLRSRAIAGDPTLGEP